MRPKVSPSLGGIQPHPAAGATRHVTCLRPIVCGYLLHALGDSLSVLDAPWAVMYSSIIISQEHDTGIPQEMNFMGNRLRRPSKYSENRKNAAFSLLIQDPPSRVGASSRKGEV